jgi:streptogramin lyase
MTRAATTARRLLATFGALALVGAFQLSQRNALAAQSAVDIDDFPTAPGDAFGITRGPDGNVWFSGFSANIGMVFPSTGSVLTFPAADSNGSEGITAGPDRNLWFVEPTPNKIGIMSLAGTLLDECSIPTAASNPKRITAGPDGNIWFTEEVGNRVGRITPGSCTVTEFPASPDVLDPGPRSSMRSTASSPPLLASVFGLAPDCV